MTAEVKTPRHVAVIMDGNGRWAERRGLPRLSGHKKGFDAFLDLVENCNNMGVGYLTGVRFFHRKLEAQHRRSRRSDGTADYGNEKIHIRPQRTQYTLPRDRRHDVFQRFNA